MINKILRSETPVTLVGGGAVGPRDLALAMSLAPVLAAADSGARTLLRAGHLPAAVIGDFDSLRAADKARIPSDRLFPVDEQDSTDFDKALQRIESPLVLGVGFLGARVDHQLAAFNTLVRFTDPPCILIGRREIVFHLPRRVHLPLDEGDTVSLFPMSKVTGRSSGLHWPIDSLVFDPAGRIGTSNRATGPVTIDTDGRGLLVIVPRNALAAVAGALRSPPDAARR